MFSLTKYKYSFFDKSLNTVILQLFTNKTFIEVNLPVNIYRDNFTRVYTYKRLKVVQPSSSLNKKKVDTQNRDSSYEWSRPVLENGQKI